MPDKIQKALARLTVKERAAIKAVLAKLQQGKLDNLDIKKLKGQPGIYRVRKGSVRIFISHHCGLIHILAIERRTTTTYK